LHDYNGRNQSYDMKYVSTMWDICELGKWQNCRKIV